MSMMLKPLVWQDKEHRSTTATITGIYEIAKTAPQQWKFYYQRPGKTAAYVVSESKTREDGKEAAERHHAKVLAEYFEPTPHGAVTVRFAAIEPAESNRPKVGQQVPRENFPEPDLWRGKAAVLSSRGRNNSLFDISQAALYLDEAAAIVEILRQTVRRLNERLDTQQANKRETFEAMVAMRDAINEHIPLPSLESDLLNGPSDAVFCQVVAEHVIKYVMAEPDRHRAIVTAGGRGHSKSFLPQLLAEVKEITDALAPFIREADRLAGDWFPNEAPVQVAFSHLTYGDFRRLRKVRGEKKEN